MSHRHTLGLVVSTCLLGACTSMSGLDASTSYGCKAPEGVKCESVSGTYHNAVANNLPAQRKAPAGSTATPAPALQEAQHAPGETPFTVVAAAKTPAAGPSVPTLAPQSLRSGPRVLRLWIKPWEDSDRDLNGESVVFVQVESGRWLIENAQRQARSAYTPRTVNDAMASKTLQEPLTRSQAASPPTARVETAPKPADLSATLRTLARQAQPPAPTQPSSPD